MTEYITKEDWLSHEAEKILSESDKLGLLKPGTVGWLIAKSAVVNALNLAFEQRLEVVGYAFSGTLSVLKVVGDGSIYVEKDLSEHQDTPLYALKGDSK
jgi:hypothetical protein